MRIIGRMTEQAALKEYVESDKPEFVAVYGRRRVGKTFLIREFFLNKFTFHITGLANTEMQIQLRNFNAALQKYGKMPFPIVTNWFDAFGQLIHLIENTSQKTKKVVFFDELPWMDTHRSGFITALEHFWNGWASSKPDILLFACGSSTSWMINNLIKNHGGLHNRITRRMLIEPFTLGECEAYYKYNKIAMSRHQIVEGYMALGGIPYYLSLMKKGSSLSQNIDALCFAQNGTLKDEFSILFSSLFKQSENHVKVVESLGRKAKGMTREEIIKTSRLPDGGGLSKTLEELEQCGFIRRYRSYGKKSKLQIYQLIDFYTLFYLNFIKDNNFDDENFWTNFIDNARHRAWSGYAFEQVCMAHIRQIKNKLGIAGVLTYTASWRSQKSEPGAQVDLLIDRNDQVINLCEIKYANAEFAIDKRYDEVFRHKKNAFEQESNTKKAVHLTMITTYGVRRNEFSGSIQSEIKMDDLFD